MVREMHGDRKEKQRYSLIPEDTSGAVMTIERGAKNVKPSLEEWRD